MSDCIYALKKEIIALGKSYVTTNIYNCIKIQNLEENEKAMSRHVPESVKRKLLEETQFRCGFCMTSIEHCFDDDNFFKFGENAHIEPYKDTQDNSFENLITLCPSCHKKFDKSPDKEESIKRLKDLKRHWFVASGKYTKLELDCLMALYHEKKEVWLKVRTFTNPEGKKVALLSFSVPKNQSYLFQNLIHDKLVLAIELQGALMEDGIRFRSGIPAEDNLVFIITESGREFCNKFTN